MYFCLFFLVLYPSIHVLISPSLSLSIYILSIHIDIKEIYVKTFRSDLSPQKKPLL